MTVDAIADLVEVLLEIFGRNTVISSQQKGLQIVDRDMHSGQPFARLECFSMVFDNGLFRRDQ